MTWFLCPATWRKKLPTQLRQNRRGEAGLAALQPCMDVARFVSFALMGRFQDVWGTCFQLATRWGESEATWLQPDHSQDGLMKWNENSNMNYAQWYHPGAPSPSCMVPPNGNGRWRQHLLPQSALVDMTITDHNKPPGLMTEPPRRRIGRGAEVLEGNCGIVRVAERLANSIRTWRRQSAAIIHLFQFFFRFFMSTLLIFVGVACQCLSLLGTICFHEVIYHLRTPAGQTGPKSTLRSRNSACWNPSRWDIPTIRPAKSSYIQQKNRISKLPSPWKKTRNLLVSNFLRQSRALKKLTKLNELVIVQRSLQ